MGFADNSFSTVGYLVACGLVIVFVVLPVAMMGLKSKNVFRGRSGGGLPLRWSASLSSTRNLADCVQPYKPHTMRLVYQQKQQHHRGSTPKISYLPTSLPKKRSHWFILVFLWIYWYCVIQRNGTFSQQSSSHYHKNKNINTHVLHETFKLGEQQAEFIVCRWEILGVYTITCTFSHVSYSWHTHGHQSDAVPSW